MANKSQEIISSINNTFYSEFQKLANEFINLVLERANFGSANDDLAKLYQHLQNCNIFFEKSKDNLNIEKFMCLYESLKPMLKKEISDTILAKDHGLMIGVIYLIYMSLDYLTQNENECSENIFMTLSEVLKNINIEKDVINTVYNSQQVNTNTRKDLFCILATHEDFFDFIYRYRKESGHHNIDDSLKKPLATRVNYMKLYFTLLIDKKLIAYDLDKISTLNSCLIRTANKIAKAFIDNSINIRIDILEILNTLYHAIYDFKINSKDEHELDKLLTEIKQSIIKQLRLVPNKLIQTNKSESLLKITSNTLRTLVVNMKHQKSKEFPLLKLMEATAICAKNLKNMELAYIINFAGTVISINTGKDDADILEMLEQFSRCIGYSNLKTEELIFLTSFFIEKMDGVLNRQTTSKNRSKNNTNDSPNPKYKYYQHIILCAEYLHIRRLFPTNISKEELRQLIYTCEFIRKYQFNRDPIIAAKDISLHGRELHYRQLYISNFKDGSIDYKGILFRQACLCIQHTIDLARKNSQDMKAIENHSAIEADILHDCLEKINNPYAIDLLTLICFCVSLLPFAKESVAAIAAAGAIESMKTLVPQIVELLQKIKNPQSVCNQDLNEFLKLFILLPNESLDSVNINWLYVQCTNILSNANYLTYLTITNNSEIINDKEQSAVLIEKSITMRAKLFIPELKSLFPTEHYLDNIKLLYLALKNKINQKEVVNHQEKLDYFQQIIFLLDYILTPENSSKFKSEYFDLVHDIIQLSNKSFVICNALEERGIKKLDSILNAITLPRNNLKQNTNNTPVQFTKLRAAILSICAALLENDLTKPMLNKKATNNTPNKGTNKQNIKNQKHQEIKSRASTNVTHKSILKRSASENTSPNVVKTPVLIPKSSGASKQQALPIKDDKQQNSSINIISSSTLQNSESAVGNSTNAKITEDKNNLLAYDVVIPELFFVPKKEPNKHRNHKKTNSKTFKKSKTETTSDIKSQDMVEKILRNKGQIDQAAAKTITADHNKKLFEKISSSLNGKTPNEILSTLYKQYNEQKPGTEDTSLIDAHNVLWNQVSIAVGEVLEFDPTKSIDVKELKRWSDTTKNYLHSYNYSLQTYSDKDLHEKFSYVQLLDHMTMMKQKKTSTKLKLFDNSEQTEKTNEKAIINSNIGTPRGSHSL